MTKTIRKITNCKTGDELAQSQVLQLTIKDLKPYRCNARTHDDKQVAAIAASITEFGFTNPVLID